MHDSDEDGDDDDEDEYDDDDGERKSRVLAHVCLTMSARGHLIEV